MWGSVALLSRWPLPYSVWMLSHHHQHGFPRKLQAGPGCKSTAPGQTLTMSVKLQNSSSRSSIPSMVSSTSFAWKETISWRLASGFQGDGRPSFFFFFFNRPPF